jgi:hypothetical protein
MAEITIRTLAESEKKAFQEALQLKEYTDEEKKFISDAISSWDYVLAFMEGAKALPSPDDDVTSREGKRWCYLRGSILNIVMAENLVLGQWGNLHLGCATPIIEEPKAKSGSVVKPVPKPVPKKKAEDSGVRSVAEMLVSGVKGFGSFRKKKKEPDDEEPKKGPDKKEPEKGPDKKEPEKGPDKKEPEKGPDKKKPEKGPDKKEPEKGPEKKEDQKSVVEGKRAPLCVQHMASNRS